MKNLRVLCWVWIVTSTIVILFHAPVSVTRKNFAKDSQVTNTEWIGPFKEPFSERFTRGDVTKSSIDFSRLVIAILAANFLPAVLLWRRDEVVEWLERQQRHPVTIDQSPKNEMLARARAQRETAPRELLITGVICFVNIALFLVGVLMKNAQEVNRTPPGESSARSAPNFDWASAKEVTPPSKSKPTAAPKVSRTTGYPLIPPPPRFAARFLLHDEARWATVTPRWDVLARTLPSRAIWNVAMPQTLDPTFSGSALASTALS